MVVRIFDLEQPSEPIIKFEGCMGGIKQVMYNPGNKQLVSFSDDKTVRVWDTSGDIKSFVITDQIVGKEEMTKDGEILTLTDGNKVIFLDANRLE